MVIEPLFRLPRLTFLKRSGGASHVKHFGNHRMMHSHPFPRVDNRVRKTASLQHLPSFRISWIVKCVFQIEEKRRVVANDHCAGTRAIRCFVSHMLPRLNEAWRGIMLAGNYPEPADE